ncbi:dipeptidyl aminopeptidase/acylaminoacyl peptidase [Novosphingobium kunmingense]|uniref:Dipeptidyl aminopeptidase/acylaminoacyl peptidase n=1 Tax=Novosphingobium kunmingense TaxID=1211806 RepID=A0A2N0HL06_9SPHN|nr:S9 family peptidase [Novosphingobium kunmingense]PKB19558.1 dipeptidyl aminopeptidase/acylaminoacyl peptidase [Novosphingobium kunmingense]
MSARFRLLAAAALAVTASSAAPILAKTPGAANPLIPRQALYGNPVKAAAQISPDGSTLSWLAPVAGVMNVWVAPIGKPDAGRPITNEKTRPIRQYFWAPDGKSVLFIQDKGGDENFLLYSVDPKTGQERSLTPFTKTRVQLIGASTVHKDRILVGLNNRDARFHDVHSLDLATGKLTEVLRNEQGYVGFLADNNLVVRMALKANAKGGQDYFQVTDNKIAETPFASTGLEDALTTNPAGFTVDGKTLYWVDSRGRNTAALVAQDVATGATKVLAEDTRADVGGTLSNPTTGVVEAYSVNYLRNEWTAVDPGIKASLDFLKKNLRGDFSVSSRTDKDDLWIVNDDPVTAPGSAYLYNRKAGKLTKLFTPRPELVGAPLPAMHPRVIKARDGLDLVSYLTLPFGTDTDANGVPTAPVPMVLLVHGGPWARDVYGSNRAHQWLSNRGYAVLSVNFRGSTGLGKSFIEAGNLQWGRKMHDDLLDAVDWAVAQKITSADKVAIMGGSYGGYATLAGMTFTPTKFACGVDIVGPSNLETLLKTIPPYWAPLVKQFHDRMGNPNTPEGLALLKERSPLYSADKIVRPLLIGQGANDPRVNQAESDQIVAAMKARSIPVTYVLFPDEGHGFARPANNIAFNAVAENFLGQCLGGRAEPIGNDMTPSTAQVLEGAERIAGLTAARK